MTRPGGTLLVAWEKVLAPGSGGVQLVAAEFQATLLAAGYTVQSFTYDADRRLAARLYKRLVRPIYPAHWPPAFVPALLDRIGRGDVGTVFLYGTSQGVLARPIKDRFGDRTRVVLLSYGLDSVDALHAHRIAERYAEAGLDAPSAARLGRYLTAEQRVREDVDAVLTLAPFEAEIERWLGAKAVGWLPRTVTAPLLNWAPVTGQAGFVGSLNHPPNYEGLRAVLDALSMTSLPQGFQVRVVGEPVRLGRQLAARFPFVQYLGGLSDAELVAEVATWQVFLHPIFCWPRGCSTKLAQVLGWRLPVVVTPAGCRGYVWTDGSLPTATDPASFAKLVLDLVNPMAATGAQEQTQRVATSCPTLAEAGATLRATLGDGPPAGWATDRSTHPLPERRGCAV